MTTETIPFSEGELKKFASVFIENKFKSVKHELLDELRAEKELMLFDLVSALAVSQAGARKASSEVKEFRKLR